MGLTMVFLVEQLPNMIVSASVDPKNGGKIMGDPGWMFHQKIGIIAPAKRSLEPFNMDALWS